MNTHVDQVTQAVATFDATAAGIAELERQFKGVVFPVDTPKGLEDAKKARAAIREPRYEIEKVRTAAKAPILELGRSLDARAKTITAQLLALEHLATLAPILHWRVCLVWDWLRVYAPMREYGAWYTAPIADAYGGDEAEEVNARTGCNGCPLAEKETALDAVLLTPDWEYLAPLKRLKPLYRWLRRPENRLRKPGLEPLKGGGFASNPQRLGPLTFAAREAALVALLNIQREINTAARGSGRPEIDMLDTEEEARIRELIAAKTWPNGWEGDEPTGDVPLDKVYEDGVVQPLLVR